MRCLRISAGVFPGLLVLALLVDAEAQGIRTSEKSQRSSIPPTFAKDLKATVPRSGRVSIPLEIIPFQPADSHCEILDRPLHGEVRFELLGGQGRVAAVYQHDGSREPSRDSFSYRASVRGRAKSVPAIVTLRIIPPPPRLACAISVSDFGILLLDEKKSAKLQITNTGGSRVTGRLIPPVGFEFPEGNSFNLDEGETIAIPVDFHPMENRPYEGEITSAPYIEGSMPHVKGIGMPRYRVERSGVASVLFRNLSHQELKVETSGGEGWGIPSRLIIPSQKDLAIPLSVRESDNPESDSAEYLNVSDGLTQTNVTLPPVMKYSPLIIQKTGADAPLTTSVGESLSLRFRFLNPSSHTKSISWKTSSRTGYSDDQLTNSIVLDPGQVRECEVKWIPSIPGNALVELDAIDGGKKPVIIRWAVDVHKQAPPSHPIADDNASSHGVQEPATPGPEQSLMLTIPPLEDVTWMIKENYLLGRRSLVINYTIPFQGKEFITLEQLHPVFAGDARLSDAGSVFQKKPGTLMLTDFEVSRSGDREAITYRHAYPGAHELLLNIRDDPMGTPKACAHLSVVIPPWVPWWKNWRFYAGFVLLIYLARRIRNWWIRPL